MYRGSWPCPWYLHLHKVIIVYTCTKRIPCCHSSGQSCPGESGPIPRRAFRRAGTTLSRRNDSVGFFFSPVTIILLQKIRTKTSLDQFCIRCIQIYRLLWSSARVRNELLTNHRRDIKTHGEGRWTRPGWIYPMFDVIRHSDIPGIHNQSINQSTSTYAHRLSWNMIYEHVICVQKAGIRFVTPVIGCCGLTWTCHLYWTWGLNQIYYGVEIVVYSRHRW